jgi:hypothetical protein
MKSADEKTMGVTKEGNITDNTIEEHVSEEGLYADLLRGEVTQEVMEMRDSNYRGYRGSFDYKYLGNGSVIKKENMATPKLNVFNPDNLNVLLIQDNKLIVQGVLEATENAEKEGDEVSNKNSNFSLTFERDVFPRFLLEKYVKKIVVRENGINNKIDLYCSTYARQFNPTDSLFITELKNIFENKIKPSDTVMIDTIEFITDACYGSKDIVLFKFGNLNYETINMYDGNFVITYSATPICNGIDLTEKYRTKEMDMKYENKEMRENAKLYFEEPEEKTFDITQAMDLLKEFNG